MWVRVKPGPNGRLLPVEGTRQHEAGKKIRPYIVAAAIPERRLPKTLTLMLEVIL